MRHQKLKKKFLKLPPKNPINRYLKQSNMTRQESIQIYFCFNIFYFSSRSTEQ